MPADRLFLLLFCLVLICHKAEAKTAPSNQYNYTLWIEPHSIFGSRIDTGGVPDGYALHVDNPHILKNIISVLHRSHYSPGEGPLNNNQNSPELFIRLDYTKPKGVKCKWDINLSQEHRQHSTLYTHYNFTPYSEKHYHGSLTHSQLKLILHLTRYCMKKLHNHAPGFRLEQLGD